MSPVDTPSIQAATITAGDDAFITVFAPGFDARTIGQDHPSFNKVVALCAQETARVITGDGERVDPQEVYDLLDVEATVTKAFERLTERVTIENGVVHLDGDPVHGALQTQIVDFLNEGDDFGPLVRFYEKLTTNPLGNVQDGLFTWMQAQREKSGTLSITPDGDLIGYKSVHSRESDWREDVEEGETVYVPSRASLQRDRVNNVEVPEGKYIEQVPGDVVEMPRSKVLNAPSQACGDGLHIGTYDYAESFQGDTVLLVKFNPRDIVSLPDSNSTWKLRVCRYTVLGPCDGPLNTSLYVTENDAEAIDDTVGAVATDLILD